MRTFKVNIGKGRSKADFLIPHFNYKNRIDFTGILLSNCLYHFGEEYEDSLLHSILGVKCLFSSASYTIKWKRHYINPSIFEVYISVWDGKNLSILFIGVVEYGAEFKIQIVFRSKERVIDTSLTVDYYGTPRTIRKSLFFNPNKFCKFGMYEMPRLSFVKAPNDMNMLLKIY